MWNSITNGMKQEAVELLDSSPDNTSTNKYYDYDRTESAPDQR